MENDRRGAAIRIGEFPHAGRDVARRPVQRDHALDHAFADQRRRDIADTGKAHELRRPVDPCYRDRRTARRSKGAMDGFHDPDTVHLIALLESLHGAPRSRGSVWSVAGTVNSEEARDPALEAKSPGIATFELPWIGKKDDANLAIARDAGRAVFGKNTCHDDGAGARPRIDVEDVGLPPDGAEPRARRAHGRVPVFKR